MLVGRLGWRGNLSFVLEVDNKKEVGVIWGINGYGWEYSVKENEMLGSGDFYFS